MMLLMPSPGNPKMVLTPQSSRRSMSRSAVVLATVVSFPHVATYLSGVPASFMPSRETTPERVRMRARDNLTHDGVGREPLSCLPSPARAPVRGPGRRLHGLELALAIPGRGVPDLHDTQVWSRLAQNLLRCLDR